MKAYMIFTKSDREPAIRNIYRTFSAAKRVAAGEEAVYPIMTIYKNVESGELEVEE